MVLRFRRVLDWVVIGTGAMEVESEPLLYSENSSGRISPCISLLDLV